MRTNKQSTTILILIFIIIYVVPSSINAGEYVSKLNKDAELVDLNNQAAINAFISQYGVDVEPLAGYGKMQWGISIKAAKLLSGFSDMLFPCFVWDGIDYDQWPEFLKIYNLFDQEPVPTSGYDSEKTRAVVFLTYDYWLTGIPFAPTFQQLSSNVDNKI